MIPWCSCFVVCLAVLLAIRTAPSHTRPTHTVEMPSLAPGAVTPPSAEMVAAMNGAGFAMFRALTAGKGTENVFLSPFSIDGAFGLAYAGAAGDTATQIRAALGLPDGGADACGKVFAALHQAYAVVDPLKLYVSNSVWADTKQRVLPAYLDTVAKYYGGAFYQEDFTHGAAVANKINKYVEDRTNNMIKNLLSPGQITPETSLILLNTLYFEAEWEHAFSKDKTSDQPFTLPGGSTRTVRLMFQKTRLPYFQDHATGVHGVVLPYKNPRFALMAVMPQDAGSDQGMAGLAKAAARLAEDPSLLTTWVDSAESGETQIWLPRTKLDYKVELSSLLQSLGMKDAFTSKADFSGISGQRGLSISAVIHQTALEMDEVSTKAAAATAIMMECCAMPMEPDHIFRADRPFLVFIRDMESGLVLFEGLVMDPGDGSSQVA